MKNGHYKDEDGNQYWYLNGKLHREDGPAVIWANGNKFWFLNGKCHREDGPAYISSDGTQAWWVNGEYHREDGPARIFSNGTQLWYLNRKNVTDEVNEWFKEYNLTYETMDEEERMIFGFHIRSLMS